MNTLIELLQYGQSYWLDNLTRGKITTGELKKRVDEQGLRGNLGKNIDEGLGKLFQSIENAKQHQTQEPVM